MRLRRIFSLSEVDGRNHGFRVLLCFALPLGAGIKSLPRTLFGILQFYAGKSDGTNCKLPAFETATELLFCLGEQ